MLSRPVSALILTPLVIGVIAAGSYLVAATPHGIGPREAIQIGGWILITLAFECIVLIPLKRLLSNSRFPRLMLFMVGWILWLLFSFAWYTFAFRLPPAESIVAAVPMGFAGIAICVLFVGLSGPAQHA
jgi:hypothetical protein